MDLDATSVRLGRILDRLAHESTTEMDCLQTVAALRRITKGAMPARIVVLDSATAGTARQITQLREAVSDARRTAQKSRESEQRIRDELAKLLIQHTQLKNDFTQPQAGRAQAAPKADKTMYSYIEVMDIIRDKFGKHNGAFAAWAAHSTVLSKTNPSIRQVTDHWLQSCRRKKSFPDWAVKQLIEMPIPQRVNHKWSEEDIDFLRMAHLAHPNHSDDTLARLCSVRFGVSIPVSSIKGKLHILRRQGRVPIVRMPKSRMRA